MEIPKDLKDEIWEYCRLNDITDLNAFMVKMLRQGYNSEKYGPTPFLPNQKQPEIIEKEVIREVEVIKEIEKIVEIPVEKIVEVVKEVYVSNDEIVKNLLDEFEIERVGYLKTQNEKDVEIETLNRNISDLTTEISQLKDGSPSEKTIKILTQQVENLKIELELEKNRQYQPPKKDRTNEIPNNTGVGNIINWVSKNERSDNIYDE
jgi:hypothetical protein